MQDGRSNVASTSERLQTRAEEVANAVSHGIGFLAAVVAVPILIWAVVQRSDVAGLVGVCVFGAATLLLYLTSTLYHALPHSRAKRVLRLLDHMAIFLMIAGSYTPFTLGVLRGGWGWALFGTIWSLALAGIILKLLFGARYPIVSNAVYLGMGWLVVVAIKPLWSVLPGWGFFWLAAGGIAYTVGVFFYARDQVPFGHFVWHLFVLAGSACHFVAIYLYAV